MEPSHFSSAHKASARTSLRTIAFACAAITLGLFLCPPASSAAQTEASGAASESSAFSRVGSTPDAKGSEAPIVLPPALRAFASAWTEVTSYTATITVFEQQDTRVEHAVFTYTFRKPENITLQINSGSNAGATVAWNGGATVVASKGHGFFGLFKKSVGLHDPLVTTLRGDSVDQISFGSILEHATTTPGTVTQALGNAIDDVPVTVITLTAEAAANNNGLTREELYLSESTHLPIQVTGYEGAKLVRYIDFTNVKVVSQPKN